MKFLIVLSALFAVAYGNFVPKLDGRIVGGEQVDIADYPYQVSVRIYDQHICGGSIIDANTVLTAAHCVHGMDQTQYSIRAGNTYHEKGQQIKVKLVVKNKNYNPNTIDHDMAILKLATPLTFNNNIQAINLQSGGNPSSGTKAWVSGWGVTKEGSQSVPAALRAVDVAVVTNEVCNQKYGSGSITGQMMCAQTLNHDSCQGDSGGPLAANGKLVGVVSWGYGCARPQYPGVYASVSSMNAWIQANRA